MPAKLIDERSHFEYDVEGGGLNDRWEDIQLLSDFIDPEGDVVLYSAKHLGGNEEIVLKVSAVF